MRQRPEGLPALLEHFLAKACLLARKTRRFSPGLVQALSAYTWPGNMRELSHLLMQRLAAFSPGYEIGLDDLPTEVAAALSPAPADPRDLAAIPRVGGDQGYQAGLSL